MTKIVNVKFHSDNNRDVFRLRYLRIYGTPLTIFLKKA